MNKQLLAMAVAGAIFAPAIASADVTVYGRVQVEYNVEDSDGVSGSSQSVDDEAGQSRLGVKFDEKLGDGLTAFGKVEFRLDAADVNRTGTNGGGNYGSQRNTVLGQREAFVGLKSSWGSIAAGSFHSPYKTAGGVKWDPWAATHLQARRAGGMTGGAGFGGHNGFIRNAIYYTSPDVNGFKAAFAISPDETNSGAGNGSICGDSTDTACTTAGSTNGDDNDWGLSVEYKNGPWNAIFAHTHDNNQNVDDQTLTKVGLKWNQGPWTVAGQYEWVRDASTSYGSGAPGAGNTANAGTTPGGPQSEAYRPGNGDDANVLWLNGQYKAGNNIFSLSYGQTDIDETAANGGSNVDYDYWAVGVIHKFSKKTRVFGGYSATDGDSGSNGDDRDVWTVGLRHDF